METVKTLSQTDITIIVIGILMGTIARLITLKVDFRQIPTYPSAYFNNIVLGFIASALGTLAIPALLAKDYVAVTFLTVAAQQFREVRKTERESFGKLEHTEYTERGEAYIDGIAKTFESRNYISLITSLVTVLVIKIVGSDNTAVMVFCGGGAGAVFIYFGYWFTKGKTVAHICRVKPGEIKVEGSELYVDGMFVTNYLGSDRGRDLFMKEGIAVVLEPKDEMSRVTLENYGQRQAILFEAVRTLGLKRYKFTRRNFTSGKVVIAFVPAVYDMDKLIAAVSHTPILENSRKIKRIMNPWNCKVEMKK